jgi:hypothetical protein
MLLKAELALADGNFFRARQITRNANTLLDATQKLHRKFMDKLMGFLQRMQEMEEKGYDINEAQKLMDQARTKAMKSDYEKALATIRKVEPALDRATYLPFPLLNKTLDIISTIFYSDGKINYSVRIENPMSEPLGEIIIRPFLSEKDFQNVPERYYGIIGPREFKESTFLLVPKDKDWNLGIRGEILMGEGVMLRTRLSSKGGTAKYFITIENNSDQIIRDVRVAPMAPGGLESDPTQQMIDFVEPFAQKTVEFSLFPAVLQQFKEKAKEKVVVLEEEITEDVDIEMDEEEEDIQGWEEEEEIVSEEEETLPDDEGIDLEAVEDEASGPEEGPRDFTPVEEEYNLISMVPPRYPEEIDMELKMKRRKQRRR